MEPPAPQNPPGPYRGRLAPTSSGWLHLGHAATFTTAWERARQAGGTLLYRTEDLDPARCRSEYALGAMEDLRWWGLDWDEGPDIGGPSAPYVQSERMELFRSALGALWESGQIYPSPHSRREIAAAVRQKSPVDGEPLFPSRLGQATGKAPDLLKPGLPWRFRVPEGRTLRFHDNRTGPKAYLAGVDFGDFLVWRRDGVPAYELAVVVDDQAMGISEVVRGEDLLLSTARQLLLYEALGWVPPQWFHCPLVLDPATGERMSKTHRSLALRELRAKGYPPRQPPEVYLKGP